MTRRRRTRVHARTACAACARVLAPQKTRVHPETHSQAKVEAYRIHRRGRTARARVHRHNGTREAPFKWWMEPRHGVRTPMYCLLLFNA